MCAELAEEFLHAGTREKLKNLSEYALWGLIFCLGFSLSLVEIFFTASLVFFLFRKGLIFYMSDKNKYRSLSLPRTELNRPLLVFALSAIFALIFSIDHTRSLWGVFTKYFKWIMVFYLVVEHIDSPKKINNMLKVVFAAVCLISFNALWQAFFGTDFLRGFSSSSHRIQGAMTNPNNLAGYFTVMAPLFFALSCSSKKVAHMLMPIKNKLLSRVFFLMVVAAFFVTLILTFSRGAWLGVFFALLLVSLTRSYKMFLAILIFPLIAFFVFPEIVSQRIMDIFSDPDHRRFALWRQAVVMIKDRPLFGFGLNTYTLVAREYATRFTGGFYPHNSYLHLGVETGLFGLLSFFWVLIRFFKKGLFCVKNFSGNRKALMTGLLGGVSAFLFQSFFDTNLFSVQLGVLLWFMMGYTVAVVKVREIGKETCERG